MSRNPVNPWICTMSSAQSRDDLAITLTPKKTKKEKGFFALFRSSSDPDLTCEMKNGTLGKKHKDKFPPSREVMGNGLHHSIPEEVIKEKGDTEETKEKRKERREKEKSEDRGGKIKREKSSKKDREDDREKAEKKPEKRREKDREKERDKEKKHTRREEKEGSEADCSICQEKIRKSREKSHSKESSRQKDKEHRSKSEHKRSKDYYEEDSKDRGEKHKQDDEKDYRRKKHHHDKEKEKDKSRKDKHHHHHDKHYHKRKSEEQSSGNEVDFGPIPCNPAYCATCKASLGRLEAWQERCTAEIESTRRRLEHRLQRLEKKLEHQQSEERLSKEKENREKEYDRVLGRVTNECREVSKSVKDSSGDVKEEIRGLIKGGLSKLELKLGQISTGYNIPFVEFKDRCNPELGRNCSADRGVRRSLRSRSSPHLGRAPCEDCASAIEHRGLMSPSPSPLSVSRTLTSGTSSVVSSRVSSRANVSDAGSVETVIEARPVAEDDVLRVPETILEARPVLEESFHNVGDTYAAAQVQHQRQVQEVEKWWRDKAEEEQRVLYARICELEQMLMTTRVGSDNGGASGCIV